MSHTDWKKRGDEPASAMTIREQLAMAAMQSILISRPSYPHEELAKEAFYMASHMLYVAKETA